MAKITPSKHDNELALIEKARTLKKRLSEIMEMQKEAESLAQTQKFMQSIVLLEKARANYQDLILESDDIEGNFIDRGEAFQKSLKILKNAFGSTHIAIKEGLSASTEELRTRLNKADQSIENASRSSFVKFEDELKVQDLHADVNIEINIRIELLRIIQSIAKEKSIEISTFFSKAGILYSYVLKAKKEGYQVAVLDNVGNVVNFIEGIE